MKALSVIAILTLTPTLAGCDLLDIMTGHKTKAQRDYETAQARAIVSLPADRVLDVVPLLGAPEPDLAPALIAAAKALTIFANVSSLAILYLYCFSPRMTVISSFSLMAPPRMIAPIAYTSRLAALRTAVIGNAGAPTVNTMTRRL